MTPPDTRFIELCNAVDLVEAIYDLEKSDSDWLDQLVEVGASTFDHGMGFAITEYVATPCDEGTRISERLLRTVSLPADHGERVQEALRALPPAMIVDINPPGYAGTWTEICKGHPDECQRVLEIFGFGDMLGILARDPNGIGMRVSVPLPEVAELPPKAREEWQMLGAHLATSYRLRRALASSKEPRTLLAGGFPRGAEAVIDSRQLRVLHAVDRAKPENAAEALRRGARRIDRARSKALRDDSSAALRAWRALIEGRWSLVDWFDTDARRFLVAIPNPPEVRDPRGLTEQECQVVEYALLGEPNKLIAYRLGLSQARVSRLLHSAMKKLGVKTRAQLSTKLPPLHSIQRSQAERAVG